MSTVSIALRKNRAGSTFLIMTLSNALQMCFRLLVARHMEKLERHREILLQTWQLCALCHCDVALWVLECAWQCGLRFTLSMCGWSSRRAKCLAGLSQHRLSQAQSNRDLLPFWWCGGPRVTLVEFFGCVVVLQSF